MNKSVLMALVVVVGLTVWMASGMVASEVEPAEQQTEQAEKPQALMKVAVVDSKAQGVQQVVKVQGQVEANRSLTLKAQVQGAIAQLPAPQGSRVEAGALLAKQDVEYRQAQLAEAKALLTQRKNDLAVSRKLNKRGLQSKNQVIADQAAVEAAQAQLARVRYELTSTQTKAPFAGVVNRLDVEIGDYLSVGDPLLQFVDDKRLKVTGQVPQHSIQGLAVGQSVPVTLSNGVELVGELGYIAQVADSATRSYRVEVLVDNPEHKRYIGLTATLELPVAERQGHLLPGSVLGLDSAGELQVKWLDSEQRVQASKVEIIRTAQQGFWLSGLATERQVIVTGQDYVAVGQQVEAVSEGAKP